MDILPIKNTLEDFLSFHKKELNDNLTKLFINDPELFNHGTPRQWTTLSEFLNLTNNEKSFMENFKYFSKGILGKENSEKVVNYLNIQNF